uniref:Putative secreted protein n=1 Tax=Anopheles marajoara TaxID=58244 RepID=A0A2M4C895_9DIPT
MVTSFLDLFPLLASASHSAMGDPLVWEKRGSSIDRRPPSKSKSRRSTRSLVIRCVPYLQRNTMIESMDRSHTGAFEVKYGLQDGLGRRTSSKRRRRNSGCTSQCSFVR